MNRPEDFDRERKQILRRLGYLTWGLWAAAAGLALAGGALVAWLFQSLGLPFVWRWLIVSAALLAIPAVIHVIMRVMGRGEENGSLDEGDEWQNRS